MRNFEGTDFDIFVKIPKKKRTSFKINLLDLKILHQKVVFFI